MVVTGGREVRPVAYASAVPVSRKRKRKSGKSGRSRGPARLDRRGSGADLVERDRHELADALRNLAAYRDQVDGRRASRAAAVATVLIADLVRAWRTSRTSS